MEWNIDLAVNHLRARMQPKSLGLCARYVRQAIAAGGINLTRTTSAKDYGSHLCTAGFIEYDDIPSDGYRAGDVVVIQNYIGGNKHGHMQMYDGTEWISDFRQNDFWPGAGYKKNTPSYKIYRRNIKYE